MTPLQNAPVSIHNPEVGSCLLYTSDAADERSSVDLGGRRIIKKTTHGETGQSGIEQTKQMRTEDR